MEINFYQEMAPEYRLQKNVSTFIPLLLDSLLMIIFILLGINKPYGLPINSSKDSEFCLQDCLPGLAEKLELGNKSIWIRFVIELVLNLSLENMYLK